jgi:hypothetical protein
MILCGSRQSILDGRSVMNAVNWILRNKEWLFSGIGVALLTLVVAFVRRRRGDTGRLQHQVVAGSQNMQAGHDINISLAPSSGLEGKQGFAEGETKLLESVSQLISDMRSDLLRPQAEFVREFFVLLNHNVIIGGSSKARFIYYEEDYQNLRGQLDVLEEYGFVTNVTPVGNRALIYRMTEKLVAQLQR